jgi:hypothetical protein
MNNKTGYRLKIDADAFSHIDYSPDLYYKNCLLLSKKKLFFIIPANHYDEKNKKRNYLIGK